MSLDCAEPAAIDQAPQTSATATVGQTWLPDDAPLAMPAQDLRAPPKGVVNLEPRLHECDLWRAVAFGLTIVAMIGAGIPSRNVLEVNGYSPLEVIAFVLFEILFGWVTFSLVITLFGVAGAVAHEPELAELKPETPMSPLKRRTAILAPVYNEAPEEVFDRLRTMERSLREVGQLDAFDLFVLSDTRDPDIAHAEQVAFERLRGEMGLRVYYRRRAVNRGRKSGNIEEWVTRFGAAYDFMVVLDADSLMTGEALTRLAGAMQAHPGVGLIQTAPRLIGRTSLFGRLQQFASRLYGPTMTNGLALFWGSEGNYWGHNAIIRVRAFAEQAGLPELKGRKPFGGHIMSHDFVEAALLRRAGWQVRIAPRLTGSFEECPPTIPDLITRDRRWCQGNLQHLALVNTRGLHWMNRFHLIQGAMGYIMSPLWLIFLVVSAFMAMHSRMAQDGEWDMYGIRVLSWVLATTFLCLFLPRIIAVSLVLTKREERMAWGTSGKLILSVILETILSALVAPIMMLSQSRALIDILRGRDSGWSAQKRGDGSIIWRDAERHHRVHMLAGIGLAVFLFWVSPQTFLWAIPVVVGLIVAAPLAVLTADPKVGALFLRWGLFATPEEIANPPRIRTPEDDQAGSGAQIYATEMELTG